MTVSRRHILVGAGALTAAALSRRVALVGRAASPGLLPLSDWMLDGIDTLVLHNGSAEALAFARSMHASAFACRVDACAVRMLTLTGFNDVAARLDEARCGALLSLLDEAETVVLEALLNTRQVYTLVRRRHGRQVLLTGRLRR